MNSSLHSLCIALMALCVAAVSTPVFAQEANQLEVTLHRVSFATKLKWTSQVLFYPKAIDPVRTLYAYKRATVCNPPHLANSSQDHLGFAVAASTGRNGAPSSGTLIAGSVRNTERVTLDDACNLIGTNSQLLLTRYPIPNQETSGRFWTNISKLTTAAVETQGTWTRDRNPESLVTGE
jgi:hypothetical protein